MRPRVTYGKIVLIVLLCTLAFLLFPQLSHLLSNAEQFINDAGVLAPLGYMLLLIVSILIIPLPSSPLAILSGALFGPWLGMLYTLIAATLGALLAFFLARFFFREAFKKHLENHPFVKKLEGKNNTNIAYIVFISRLMPQISFDLVSYAAGMTGISPLLFTLATFFGMIPIVFLLTFFGSMLEPYQNIMLLILFIVFLFSLVFFLLKHREK